MLLLTTDIRSQKALQTHSNPSAEATFWFPATEVQFRIRANVYCLPAPTHPWAASFPAARLGPPSTPWEQHRLEAYDSLPEHLRASFTRPAPGEPLANYDDSKAWVATLPRRADARDEATRKLIDAALENFALVVLEPLHVDLVELAVIPNRRTVWKKKESEEEGWEEGLVVP